MKKVMMMLVGLGCMLSANANSVALGIHEGYEYYLKPSYTKKLSPTRYEVKIERYVARDVKKDGIAQGGFTIYTRVLECKDRTVATASYENYGRNGQLIGKDKMSALKFYKIFPNSWGSSLAYELC